MAGSRFVRSMPYQRMSASRLDRSRCARRSLHRLLQIGPVDRPDDDQVFDDLEDVPGPRGAAELELGPRQVRHLVDEPARGHLHVRHQALALGFRDLSRAGSKRRGQQQQASGDDDFTHGDQKRNRAPSWISRDGKRVLLRRPNCALPELRVGVREMRLVEEVEELRRAVRASVRAERGALEHGEVRVDERGPRTSPICSCRTRAARGWRSSSCRTTGAPGPATRNVGARDVGEVAGAGVQLGRGDLDVQRLAALEARDAVDGPAAEECAGVGLTAAGCPSFTRARTAARTPS